jgi:hypothetical protein
MRKTLVICLLLFLFAAVNETAAQCSICTKTAQQLGHKPAKGLNTGIIYLMVAPLAIMGFIGYRWYRGQFGNDNSN